MSQILRSHFGRINVKDAAYAGGAKGDGVADDTAAFTAAINAWLAYSSLPGGWGRPEIYVPSGIYRCGPLPVITHTEGFVLRGAGRFASYIIFVPTANNQTWLEVNATSNSIHYNATVCDFTLRCDLTTAWNKIGINLVDVGRAVVERLNVFGPGFHLHNTDSICLRTAGREAVNVSDVHLSGSVPLVIGKNPDTTALGQPGYLSADHFTFNNTYLIIQDNVTPATLPKACVYVEPGVHVSQLQFTGYNAWVRGDYGFYWNWNANWGAGTGPVAMHAYASSLRFENVRTENGSGDSNFSIYINLGTFPTDNALRNLSIENCEFDTLRGALYTRNVSRITVDTSILGQTGARKCMDVSGAMSVEWRNVWTAPEATASQLTLEANLYELGGAPVYDTYKLPHTFSWFRQAIAATYPQNPRRGMNGASFWEWAGTLADDATLQIPINSVENIGVAEVRVSAYAAAGSPNHGSGTFLLAPGAVGTNGVELISGVNASKVDADGYLCLYSTSGLVAPTFVRNRLGATANVVVHIAYYQTATT